MSRNFKGIIKTASITKFRKMRDLEFEVGSHVTIIAGQNSTMKTTLLGMLGQPFSMRNQNAPMYDARTIDGQMFEGKLKDKFKFSPEHDKPGEHVWKLNFIDKSIYADGFIEVKSIPRNRTGELRFWSTRGREKGDGFAQLPVIFLSLKRLVPIGEAGKISISSEILTSEEQVFFAYYHNLILGLQEEILSSQYISSSSKQSIGPKTSSYSAQTISAGQDNIGKILLSILSFKRLKEKYKEHYQGGLLLIDELDATLFPAAQKKLVEMLFKFAAEYSIQIIATSHSRAVIETVLLSKYRYSGKLLYLRNKGDSIVIENDVTLEQIQADLTIKPIKPTPVPKIRVYTEDTEAVEFAKCLLGTKYTKLLSFVNVTIGCKELITLSTKRKIPEFTENLIILDGDNRDSAKNIISLPDGGSKYPPDQLLYHFLNSLAESDNFWPGYDDLGQYTKQFCFAEYPDLTPNTPSVREQYKAWYKSQKDYWGKNSSKAFQRWKRENPAAVSTFIEEFQIAYNYIAKKRSLPLL